MITRFNAYERKLNEDSAFPDWVDQKLAKSSEKLFSEKDPSGALKAIRGEDDIDATITALYNSPIKDMKVGAYAQLIGLLKEEELSNLKLEEPLTIDSTMLEVSNNYYIKNIIEIINEIASSNAGFGVDTLTKETIDELKGNPITLGTIILNSIKNWYDSEVPINSMVESLNKKVLEPDNKSTNESSEYKEINERFETVRGLFKGLFKKSGEGVKSSFSALDNEVTSIAKGVDKINVNANTFNTSGISDVVRNTPEFNQVKSGIKNAGEEAWISGKIQQPTTSSVQGRGVPELDINIPKDKQTKALNNADAPKEKNVDDLLEKLKREKQAKKDEISRIKDEKRRQREIEKENKRAERQRRVEDRRKFYRSIFVAVAPSLIKFSIYGGIIYWLASWFNENDEKSGKTPSKELLSILELDMAEDNLQPFLTFHNASKIMQEKATSGNPKDVFNSWVQGLESNGIMSSSDAQKCYDQIKSPTFDLYLDAQSKVSQPMVEAMQNKWANSFELPTPGLETIGLLSAYASVFYRFENDLYGGKIPITADEKNLDKPVGLIKRFDSNGQERNYMQLGDSGGDVKLLQQSLQKLNLYDGEINGEYDEELAKIIAGIQTNAQPTNAEIKVDGKADVLTLAYLAKQIEFLNMTSPTNLAGTISPQEINSRGEVQGYIQQMQAALANR
jgi:hypothetical protein